VTVGPDRLEIEDDGRGPLAGTEAVPAPVGAASPRAVRTAGSGLAGLTARASKAGAQLAVVPGPRGGTLLSVRRTA